MTRWFPLWTAIVVFAGLAALLFSASSTAAEPGSGSGASDGRVLIAWGHVIVLSGVLIVRRFAARFEAPHQQPQASVARSAWRQYGAGIDALCLHWVVLYGLLLFAWTRGEGFGASAGGRATMVAVELVNAVGGLIYFFLFFVLDRPTVATDDEPRRDAHFREAWLGVVAVAALAAFGSAMARLDRVPGEALIEVARHGSPVVVAIGMMYLFGRFDSTSMGIRPLSIAPLWGYVALQATWARASGPDDLVSTGVFALAFVLKLYFLAMQFIWTREGRIQRHLNLGAI